MLEKAKRVVEEVKKVIVGKDEIVEKVLMVIFASGHILLEDVPGVGKTTLALAFSKAMNLDYRRVQFTSDTMASDITGFSIYNKHTGNLEYKKGAAFCNLLLADEINRTSPKTQAALLEVMEEQRVTLDGVTHVLPKPFICIATQNPIGSAGTQNLPESQLDRFMVRLSMGYPTLENQIEIIKNREQLDPLQLVESTLSLEDILQTRTRVKAIHAADEVIRYAAVLCEATRNSPLLERGVSPRAVIAVVSLAKAHAFLRGRDFLIPEDVQAIFADVCRHRLILKPQAKVKKEAAAEILQSILQTEKAPAMIRQGK
ncbi:MAG: MoxR family ATPase [Clostridiales bacterium]|nr:MoxR family ATPase [Clostridiales bacterium]